MEIPFFVVGEAALDPCFDYGARRRGRARRFHEVFCPFFYHSFSLRTHFPDCLSVLTVARAVASRMTKLNHRE